MIVSIVSLKLQALFIILHILNTFTTIGKNITNRKSAGGMKIMIKGCAKKVVVVKDIDSNFFEEAFFIVKPGKMQVKNHESAYINEANRIVKSDLHMKGNTFLPCNIAKAPDRQKNKSIYRDMLMFIFGFGISAVFCTFIYYSGIL